MNDSVRPISVRPLNLLICLFLPAWLLLWLVVFAPHALDLAVARAIDQAGLGPALDAAFGSWIRPFLHEVSKYTAIAAAALVLFRLIGSLRAPAADPERKKLVYILAAMLACVALVGFLKQTTGVFCPRTTTAFGGVNPITDPHFGLSVVPGNCWPGGAAGSGFCLFAFFFALRERHPKAARLALGAALVLGSVSGFERMTGGLHFLSHNVVSLLLDWTLCAAIYALMFERHGLLARIRRDAQSLTSTGAIAFCLLWWVFVFNGPVLAHVSGLVPAAGAAHGALNLRLAAACTLLFAAGAAAILCLSFALPDLLAKALLCLLHAAAAVSFAGIVLYGALMTPDMVRNALATDWQEASGYFGLRTAFVFFWSLLPPVLVTVFAEGGRSRIRLLGCAAGALAAAAAVILLNFQMFAGAIRSDKSLRYQIAPVTLVASVVRTLTQDASPDGARQKTVTDPAPVLTARYDKPSLFVVVVGETTRSANWGLAGYKRLAECRLVARDLISFPVVTACGTSTDVSLPCMMSRIGRSDYNRKRIISEEALPDILQRAGYAVKWIDNQSGCKGVCSRVESRRTDSRLNPALCPDGRCYDGILIEEVKREAARLKASGSAKPVVLFLHMIGQHGPAYTARSPQKDKVFGPECTDSDLSSCSREGIVNAYDNGVAYTDRVLDGIIDVLESQKDIASGLLFVSDHGESLGEHGLYLHGSPYWLGLREQIDVPMLLWFSDDLQKKEGGRIEALRLNSDRVKPSHENFYHTMLGLLGVQSTTYRPEFDLTRPKPAA